MSDFLARRASPVPHLLCQLECHATELSESATMASLQSCAAIRPMRLYQIMIEDGVAWRMRVLNAGANYN